MREADPDSMFWNDDYLAHMVNNKIGMPTYNSTWPCGDFGVRSVQFETMLTLGTEPAARPRGSMAERIVGMSCT